MLRVAYFCEPDIGGTFTTFEALRRVLLHADIDVRCVWPFVKGRAEADAGTSREGIAMIPVPEEMPAAIRSVLDYLNQERVDIVMTSPLGRLLENLIPCYLNPPIRHVLRPAMITHAAHRKARYLARFSDHIIAISSRVASDLIRLYRVPAARITTIFHGIDTTLFHGGPRRTSQAGALRCLYLGRLTDLDKGIFYLPGVLQHVVARGCPLTLTIAGEGPDRTELEHRFKKLGLDARVSFIGQIPRGQVERVLLQHDCLVAPSRTEACGWSVLEAMATGCVPIVHDISGSLGEIVEDGASGCAVPIGDVVGMAEKILLLSDTPGLRARMSLAAQDRVRQRFSADRMGLEYARVFQRVMAAPLHRRPAFSLSDFHVPRPLKASPLIHLPTPVKRGIKTLLMRMGLPA